MVARTIKSELEAEIARLHAIISEQSNRIMVPLRNAESSFLHSHTYADMETKIIVLSPFVVQ